jgi:surfeit locus 1 family protein
VIFLAAAIGVTTTFSLGRWQLSRAAQKQALWASIEQRQQLPTLDEAALAHPLDEAQLNGLLHRQVALRGRWLADRTVFLDNRPMQRHTGFYVLTPLQLAGSEAVVLVQRGWAPRHRTNRTQLPPVHTPTEEVTVTGRLTSHPPRLYALGEDQGGPIRQNLDLNTYGIETGLPLVNLMVLQNGAASEGLRRDWPEPASGVARHHGYAFQWFGLCALIALLFLWFQVVRPLYRPSRS